MGELKKHQPPMTVEEQIKNLRSIGLVIEDETYAWKILNDISYFRLVKAQKRQCYIKNIVRPELVIIGFLGFYCV